jgi:regulatory protein
MKITSIKQQVKNSERVSLFIDGKYSFSFSLDELVKYKLKTNDELTPGDVKKYKKLSEDGKLRARALEWLLNRPHSTREFKDYLYRKKAEPELSEKLIEEFSQKGYLDDVKFALWFSELRGRKGKSDRALRAELFKKGINREVVDEVIEQSAGDETSRLQILVEKKAKLPRYKNDQQKLAQYLTSQGFSYSAVREALKINQPED